VPAGLHVPAPSHARPSVCEVAFTGQDGGAQGVPAAKSSQVPLPSQKPVVSQLPAPVFMQLFVGSAPPLGTGVQVPDVVDRAQDKHVPVQVVRQQTPCAQKPLPHSVPSAQVAPGDLRPHDPPVHTAGGSQSASAAQLALHAEAPQRNGKHELAAGVTQAPAPSHVEPGVKVVPAAGQLASPHGVPCANLWQAPAAHMPFVAQLDEALATQVFEGSGAPTATSPQAPIVPGSAQDLHAAAHATAQQTPCAQKPEPHSEAFEQNAPMAFGPHELAAQTFGTTHWLSFVHEPKQRAPLQPKGAHGSDAGATHWPVLLQAEAGVKTLDSQCSAAHGVPAAYLRQPPAPSQKPSDAHMATPRSAQVPRGSAAPPGTGVHFPIAEGSAHVRQAPWHASAQQTPSTQNVLAHSVPLAQVWPLCLRPQLPATQA
jgi:hypothetical protein